MTLQKLSSSSELLLKDILEAENPVQLLCDRFHGLSSKDDCDLRADIRELKENGYISLQWANNLPYRLVINPPAKLYFQQKSNNNCDEKASNTTIIDRSIHIGDGNKFNKATVGYVSKTQECQDKKKNIIERHPILTSILLSLLTGLILMFSFWNNIIQWIEGLF